MRIQGKVALITGGSGGLGKAFAEALLKRGAKVLLVDINTEQGNHVAKSFNEQYGQNSALFNRCDVTVQEDYENAFLYAKKMFGRLDIVANNAGIMNERKWEKTIEINLTSVLRGSLLALKHLRKDQGNGGGVVVNVSSMAGLVPAFFCPAYTASKHGVIGLTRSLGADIDYPKHQVRFNALCPSFTDTDMLNVGFQDKGAIYHKDVAEKFINTRGILSDGFVAEAFIQLIEDNSRNGSILSVSRDEGISYVNHMLPPPAGLSNGQTSGSLSLSF